MIVSSEGIDVKKKYPLVVAYPTELAIIQDRKALVL